MTVASQPYRTNKGQKTVFRMAEKIGEIGQRRKSVYEVIEDRQARIEAIGQDLYLHGEKFVKKYPQWMRWLEQQGVTREQAIQAHLEWTKRQAEFSGFVPAKKPKKGRRRK